MRIYIKGRNAKNKTEVTNSAISVKWSGDKASCSRRVDASLAADDNGKFSFPCEIMDDVSLYGDKGLLFSGKIWSRTKATGTNAIDITAFDRGYYLKKCEGFYKFSKKTPKQITEQIAKDYNIKLGDVLNPNKKITRNYLGVSLYKIIQDAYTRASDSNNVQYQVVFDGEKLCVRTRGNRDKSYTISSDTNLQNATVKESAEGVITRVKIYSDKDKFVKNVDNSAAIKEFGLLTSIMRQSSSDNKNDEAKALLNRSKLAQNINVTALGDERCITGDAMYLKEPTTGVTGVFYIDEDTHEWKNGLYTNRMTLNYQNLMDSIVAGSEDGGYGASAAIKNPNTGYSSAASQQKRLATINRVLEWMRMHLTENSGWRYSQVRRWESGFCDCSSYVYRAWQSAGVKLSHKGGGLQVSFNQVMADQMYYVVGDDASVKNKKTQDVTFSLLEPGDLIFYQWPKSKNVLGGIGHVATVYDKTHIIHARSTSCGICLDSIRYMQYNIVAVRRYKG